MKTIEFKNVSFYYTKDTPILKDVSLEIPFGHYVSLIGPNGAGKSTIAKLLIGLLTPKAGEIIVDALPVNKENLPTIRKRVGIVFQNPDNQFIASTVQDDIAFGLENRCVNPNDMKGIIDKYAELVDMKEYLQKEPSYLSGGQKQRVAIAGVLALSPEILVLDEATSMLDPAGRREIHKVIKQMHEDNPNLTIVSITHDVEETLLSDEILILDEGRIKFRGTPEEVYSNDDIVNKYSLDRPVLYDIKKLFKNDKNSENIKDLQGVIEYLCPSK